MVSSKRSGWSVIGALALSASGCGLIAGLGEHELRPATDPTGGGSGGGGGAGDGAGAGAGAPDGQPVVLAEQGDKLPHALVLDDDEDNDGVFETVYWVTERAGGRALWRMPTAGGVAPTELVKLPDPMGSNPSKIEVGLAVDTDRLYWTQAAGEGSCNPIDPIYGEDMVRSIPKAGGTVDDIVDIWSECPVRGPHSVAVDGKYVFFSLSRSQSIQRVHKAFGDVVTLSGSENQPFDIAIDQTHIYWISRNDNSNGEGWIRAALKENLDTVELFATSGEPERLPNAIAVDDAHVYWADSGMIRAVDKKGMDGAVRDIVNGSGAISAIALDDEYVYWSNATAGHVLRARKDGDDVEPEVLASGQDDPEAIAVDGESIYWTNLVRGDLIKLRKP